METVTYRVVDQACFVLISTSQSGSIVSVSSDNEGASIVVCVKGSKSDVAFGKCGAVRID